MDQTTLSTQQTPTPLEAKLGDGSSQKGIAPEHSQAISTMLTLQEQINTQINAHWRAANNPWYRAIWTECAELLDHHGWKWWKKQTPNLPQIWLELVDIWHFVLSDLLQSQTDITQCVETITTALRAPRNPLPVNECVERLAQYCLTHQRINCDLFFDLTNSVQLDFQQLFEQYIGKNVLNRFRQDNGYKEGTYRKVWDAREDNEHLAELFLSLDFSQPDIAQALYLALASRYESTREAQGQQQREQEDEQ